MRLRSRLILGAIGVMIIGGGLWVKAHTPFPSEPARDAVGIKHITTPGTFDKNGSKKPSKINYVHHSRGKNGPRIVLVASAGREASDLNELALTLNTQGYRTLAVEHPGINGATVTNHNLDLMAFNIILSLQEDGYLKDDEPIYLVGHAFGNRAVRKASSLFFQMPEQKKKLKGVILLAAGGQVPMESDAQKSVLNIFNPLRSYKSRMEDVRYAFFADGNDVPDHWTRGWHTKTAMAQGKAIAASKDDESWHCAGGVPMLIVQPMQDRLAPPENAYTLRDKCPQVEIVEVQNAGHALLPEQPEAVAEAVLAFLAKHHPVE